MKIIRLLLLCAALSYTALPQWNRQVLPVGIGFLLSGDFSDSCYGVAGGYYWGLDFNAKSIYTFDSGITWYFGSVPDGARAMVSYQMLDRQNGFAAGAINTAPKQSSIKVSDQEILQPAGRVSDRKARQRQLIGKIDKGDYTAALYKTTDGGSTWLNFGKIPEEVSYLYAVHFISPSVGLLCGSGQKSNVILRSNDGGQQWKYANVPDSLANLYKIVFVSQTTGFISGYISDINVRGVVLKTTDGGDNWAGTQISGLDCANSIDFSDSLRGCIAGYPANPGGDVVTVFYTTSNAGQTWEMCQERLPGIECQDLKFIPGTDTCYMAGGIETEDSTGRITETPAVLKSINGGRNWKLEYSDTLKSYFLRHLVIAPNRGVFACGGNVFTDALMINKKPGLTSAAENEFKPAYDFRLLQNFPNPFNPVTRIEYEVLTSFENAPTAAVTLRVYDINGKLIKTLVDCQQRSGKYSVSLNASDMSSGVYYYSLKCGGKIITRKLMLLK